ncbi:type II secretion system F family protein [Candidatus Woesearchaeota archaeon]|nr:type II secretion system F family protein [Candidatus Woesearchaeota archaeon]
MRIQFVKLEEFGKAFVPERVRPRLRSYLLKAGITEVTYRLFGFLFFLSLFVSFAPYVLYAYPYLAKKSMTILTSLLYLGLGTFAFLTVSILLVAGICMLGVYFYLDLRIYKRTKEIETILPEYLQFVASNLKGGMSFDRALWSSIKPRFGVLAVEIEIAAKKVMTGGDVEDALREFTEKYDSPMLRRSFDLIIEGMRGGGQIVYVIDKVIETITETQTLKKEMAASVTSYIIFISFIVILVAPGLFALSFQLLNIVGNFASQLGASAAAGGAASSAIPIKFSATGLNKGDFRAFSIVALGIIAFFSAMIMSIIRRGDIKGGIKMIPVFLVLSIVNYEIFTFILSKVFTFV